MILEDDLYPQSIYVYNDIHFDSICNYSAIKIFRIGWDVFVSIQK
jgi:hypothetical protein